MKKLKQTIPKSAPIPSFLIALSSISKAASIFPVLVGCFVLVGWRIDVDVLKRVLPGLVAMNPATAVAFVLAGVSLWLLRTEEVYRKTRRVAQGLAFAVALVGLLKLIEVLFDWNYGFDQLLLREKLESDAAATGIINRMAPNTALNFLLLGCALLLVDWRTHRGRYPAQYLVCVAAMASLLATMGYAYGVQSFYGISSYIPMALHTALAFLILFVGLLCARPDRGVMATIISDSVGGTIARRLLPPAILLPLVLGWLRLEGQRASLYDTELGAALLVLASILITTTLIMRNVTLLHRTDTKRKRTEVELRKSEARNRAVVDTASDGIITVSTDGLIRSYNAGAKRIFGYSEKEVVGQPLTRLMPERFRGSHEAGFINYLNTGEARVVGKGPVELAGLRKNSEEFPLELSLGEMREGSDITFAGIIRDTTERKRIEDELRRHSVLIGLLQAVSSASNEASTVEEAMQSCVDQVCVYTKWPIGHAYLRSLGAASGDEVVSTSIWHLEYPERFESFAKVTEGTSFSPGVELPGRVLASGEPAWIQNVGEDLNFARAERAKDIGIKAGVAFPVLVGKEVVAVLEFFCPEAKEPDGQILSAMAQVGIQLGRVFERKHVDKELRKLNENLKANNLELVRKNEEIETFVYSISHDLRSPLLNLQGFSRELELVSQDIREMFADSDLPRRAKEQGLALIDEDMKTSTKFIQTGVMRLSNIIDALLRLSRVGRVEYRHQQVELNPIVGRIVGSMQDTINKRGASITVSDLPPAWGDPTAVEQVFANLIGNALNYLDPERPGIIEVGCEEVGATSDDSSGFHTYYVKDNGLGISEQALDKVFQIFQRLHPERAEGEGVGLSLVRRMIDRHGGRIWVESTEGEGSTFFVELPEKSNER